MPLLALLALATAPRLASAFSARFTGLPSGEDIFDFCKRTYTDASAAKVAELDAAYARAGDSGNPGVTPYVAAGNKPVLTPGCVVVGGKKGDSLAVGEQLWAGKWWGLTTPDSQACDDECTVTGHLTVAALTPPHP